MLSYLTHILLTQTSSYTSQCTLTNETFPSFFSQVERHRATLNPSEPRDFVDVYLANRDTDAMGRRFCDTVLVFLPDAIDTMSIVMNWIVLYLGTYPQVQKKAQEEIDRVVGKDGQVGWLPHSCIHVNFT